MTSGAVARVRRLLLWTVAGLFVVLAATGLGLTFTYRPSAAQAWQEAVDAPSGRLRLTHQLASVLLVPVLLALFAVCLPVARRWVPAATLAVLGLALALTGRLLPWDQLALSAVTVSDMSGAWYAAFSGDVRFVLVGGAEVTQRAYRVALLAHAVGLAVAFAAALAVLARTTRHPRSR